jgi:hypothetical protein
MQPIIVVMCTMLLLFEVIRSLLSKMKDYLNVFFLLFSSLTLSFHRDKQMSNKNEFQLFIFFVGQQCDISTKLRTQFFSFSSYPGVQCILCCFYEQFLKLLSHTHSPLVSHPAALFENYFF